jgi:hypothetical protein
LDRCPRKGQAEQSQIRSGRTRGISFWSVLSLVFLGCTRTSTPETKDPRASQVERPNRPLEAYLPPTGLRLAAHLRPKALFADGLVGPPLRRLLPGSRVEAFFRVTGVNLFELREVWIAEYELGVLYVAPFLGAEHATERFLEHSESHSVGKTYAPGLVAYSVVHKREPYFLIQDQGKFTALSEGTSTLGRLVVGRALGKLENIPYALHRSGFERLPRPEDPLLSVFWASQDNPEVGQLTLTRCATGLALGILAVRIADSDPTEEWELYLHALAERPELRAAFGESPPLEGLLCRPLGADWACEAHLKVDAERVLERWGTLLTSNLESF